MDTNTVTKIDTFRAEVRAWLEENCPASMRLPASGTDELYMGGKRTGFASEDQKIWFERMLAKGWTAPSWPTAYGGGGLNKLEAKILKEEMRRISARPPLWSFGLSMLGPALLKFGTEEQKQEHLTKIISGKIWWCQGYSEPGAGSDLVGLQTRCEDMGDHFIVNGQKVWTSYADRADWIFCLVRTDPEAPKYAGISFILIDMDQEGVSTAPIKLISGKSPFCETFFDNARAEKHNVIGKLNSGWTTAKYLLTHERNMIGDLFGSAAEDPIHEMAKEKLGTIDGKVADPLLRAETARIMIDGAALKWSMERMSDEAKAGQPIGAKSSYFKYTGTELNKRKHELLLEVAGTEGITWGETYKEGQMARDMCRTKGNSIEGGTSEIQLNIISKRVLGLPGK